MTNKYVKTFDKADIDALLDLHRVWVDQHGALTVRQIAALGVQLGLPMKSTFTLLEANKLLKSGAWDRVSVQFSAGELKKVGQEWLDKLAQAELAGQEAS